MLDDGCDGLARTACGMVELLRCWTAAYLECFDIGVALREDIVCSTDLAHVLEIFTTEHIGNVQ